MDTSKRQTIAVNVLVGSVNILVMLPDRTLKHVNSIIEAARLHAAWCWKNLGREAVPAGMIEWRGFSLEEIKAAHKESSLYRAD